MSLYQRFRFIVEFTGDLDLFPGNLHQVEDWHRVATRSFDMQTSYKVASKILYSNPVMGSFAKPESERAAKMRASFAAFEKLTRANHPVHSDKYCRLVGFKLPYTDDTPSEQVMSEPMFMLDELMALAKLGLTVLDQMDQQSCPEDSPPYVGGFCSTAGAPRDFTRGDLSDTGPYATAEDETIAREAGYTVEQLRSERWSDDVIAGKPKGD